MHLCAFPPFQMYGRLKLPLPCGVFREGKLLPAPRTEGNFWALENILNTKDADDGCLVS